MCSVTPTNGGDTLKIRITKSLPIEKRLSDLAPVGSVHEVVRVDKSRWTKLYFIIVDGQEVGVYQREECEVVER